MKRLDFFVFYVWLSYLLVSSILLFSGGFLLSRTAQPYQASCSHQLSSCSEEETECYVDNLNELKYIKFDGQICIPSQYKVVILIIDALRFDFAVYDSTLKDPLPYQNKLPIIHQLLQNESGNTRLYKFMADPPTTTLQRLKALTSGTLPTFIDAGSNFGTEEINEDNFVDQLILNEKKIVFMGDDTWMGLYPNRFLRSYPFPSFNVFDLDTVDNGVKENLNFELKQNDWNVLIGHFLGVDHCGHRYGPLHPEMSRKLSEMNSVIEKVVKNLKNDTLLFVFGDHGMTITGDHGGDSDDEIKSALFVYSNQPLKNIKYSTKKEIKQVDLVPTLATILGIPIPYSNLGSVVLNSLPLNLSQSKAQPEWHNLVIPLWSNLQQMVHYIEEYSMTNKDFDKNEIESIRLKFSAIQKSVNKIENEDDFIEFQKEATEIMNFVFLICAEVWNQFDAQLMSQGLILNVVCLYLSYIIVDGIPFGKLSSVINCSFLFGSFKILTVSSSVIFILYIFHFIDHLIYSFYLITGIISAFLFGIIIIQNWESISMNWYSQSKKRNLIDIIYRLILLFHVIVPLSNSYVVEESFVSFYLLVSLFVMIVCESIYIKNMKNTLISKFSSLKLIYFFVALVGLILIRLTPNFWRCREEQSWCTLFGSHNILKSSTEIAQKYYIITLVLLAIIVILGRNWLRSCGSLTGSSLTIISYRYLPTVMIVCTGSYWILEKLPFKRKNFLFSQPKYFAWCVYLSAFELILCTVLKPLCVHIISRKSQGSNDSDKSVPHIYRKVKEMLSGDEQNNSTSDTPIIYGLTTVFSSPFIMVNITMVLLFSLLLGCASAAALVLMCLISVLFLFIVSILRHFKATNTDDLMQVPISVILGWMLISHYFFYGTGHQPTFPNIPWEAGFVGSSGNLTTHIVPAALILANIFGSFILMGFTVPLLVIAPFSIRAVFPRFFSKKHNSDSKMGDVYLYQCNEKFMGSVFSCCCKYTLLHGLQVFLSMLAATIHSRHLMVWKIFAPKFIFQSISFFITLISVSLGYLFTVNINYKVNALFEKEL